VSIKYTFKDHDGVYFVTATVVDWIDIFTRDIYRDILLNSFRFCLQNQGLQIHAWTLMTNHFHLICSFTNGANAGLIIKNIKSFTAIRIIDAIINNNSESRKNWILDILEKKGKQNKSNYRFQFWQHENHPILLSDEKMYLQRFNYLHENPVKAGFVSQPEDWRYSSAVDYYTLNRKGMLDLVRLH
jgi:putative transposase